MSELKFTPKCTLQTDYFNRRGGPSADYRPDQCVLCTKAELPHVRGFRHRPPKQPLPDPLYWYPMVNAYYNHAEDVDAYQRVNELLAEGPSTTSLPSYRSQLSEDGGAGGVGGGVPYGERHAQQQYLASRPVSFLIFGKPEVGQQEVGAKLQEHWGCEHIHPERLIVEEIESGSRAGECIEFNLRCGRAVGVDVVMRLLEKRLRSATVSHRGFVLTGVPVVPNELYEEDPVSTESAIFAVHEIFDEICEAVVDTAVPVTKHVSILSQSRVSVAEEEEEAAEADPEERRREGEEAKAAAEEGEEIPDVEPGLPDLEPPDKDVVDIGSADGSICKEPVLGAGCEEQLQFLLGLLEEPLVTVYVTCPHDDVISRRNEFRYDLRRNVTIDLQSVRMNARLRSLYSTEAGGREYEMPADLLDDARREETAGLTHLVRLPRHFPANVASQLKKYHQEALPTIERFILTHDPQNFLKVDGRLSPHMMFDVVKTRLDVLPLQRVALVERLSLPAPKQGEELDEPDAPGGGGGGMTHEQWYRQLRATVVVPGPYSWGWSDWGVKCPVSMKEGAYLDGAGHLAVRFMNKMFFLSDEHALARFQRNPRPYLLPPYPRPSCRVFVFGPRGSGRTTVSKAIGYLLDGCVLHVEDMKRGYMERKRYEHREKVKQAALIEAIGILSEQKASKRQYRDELMATWYNQIQGTMTRLFRQISRWRPKSAPPAARIELSPVIGSEHAALLSAETLATEPTVVALASAAEYKTFLADADNLRRLLPAELQYGADLDVPVTVLDPFVTRYATEAADQAVLDFSEFTDDHLVEAFMSAIQEVEDENEKTGGNRGGWVIDNIPINLNLLEMLHPYFMADDIIILQESDHYLLKHYNRDHVPKFRDFRQLFVEMGHLDAAWRAPATDSTMSVHRGFVQEILYDMVNNVYSRPEDDLPEAEAPTGPQQSWGKAIDHYADHLRLYAEDTARLQAMLADKGIAPVVVNVKEKAIDDILREVVRVMEDRYKPPAHRMTEVDRQEEARAYEQAGAEAVEAEEAGEGGGGGGQEAEDLFQRSRRYGDTSWYCPVTFHDHAVLWRGREDHAVVYEDKVYLMATEADVDAFLKVPRRYASGASAPARMPPPRVCVVGNLGAGKTTVARALARNDGLIYVGFRAQLDRAAAAELLNDSVVEAYRTGTQPLPEDFLVPFFQKMWWSEPTRTTGFVLDDFPKSPSDVEAMVTAKAIPDLVVRLAVFEGEVKKRLVRQHMQVYAREREAERVRCVAEHQVRHGEWERLRTRRLHELTEERRQQRYAQKLGERAASDGDYADGGDSSAVDGPDDSEMGLPDVANASQVTYDSFAEQEDQIDITHQLEREFPEPQFEEEEVNMEEVAAQFEEAIEVEISSHLAFMSEVKEMCLREQIPWVDIDANMDEPHTVYQAYLATGGLKERGASFMERCYDVDVETADKLLSIGYYFLSQFGKTCPVQYEKRYNPIQMYLPEKLKGALYPIIHRQFIYFLCGADARIEFMRDPLKYSRMTGVRFPLIRFRLAVTGPPKAGKTTLVRRMQAEYRLRALSCGQAVRHVLAYMPYSRLAVDLDAVLREGAHTSLDVQMRCAEAACCHPHAAAQGVIFDGFPNDLQDAAVLRDLGLTPHLILHLNSSEEEVFAHLKTCAVPRGLPVFSRAYVELRAGRYRVRFAHFRQWADREFQNVADVETGRSVWCVFREAQRLFLAVLSEIRHYYAHARDDWPLRVAGMLVTPLEFRERQSHFRTFCPCCLVDETRLKNGGDVPDRTNLVHYGKHLYWLCDEHIEGFLKTPDKYLPPMNSVRLPVELPSRRQLTHMPRDAFEKGICMVCYSLNRQRKVFTMGLPDNAVSYKGALFLFESKQCEETFMQKPQDYADLQICYKDPENMSGLRPADLPVLGYLEQYVARAVIKALNDLVSYRPVVPGLTVDVSAAVHVGLFLKTKVVMKRLGTYGKALAAYEDRRERLARYLQRMKRHLNPGVYYEEPLPKFKGYVPMRTTRDVVKSVLMDLLDRIDYSRGQRFL